MGLDVAVVFQNVKHLPTRATPDTMRVMGITIDGGFVLGILLGVAGTVLYQSHSHRSGAREMTEARPRRRLPRPRRYA
jgi:hypothetical protein